VHTDSNLAPGSPFDDGELYDVLCGGIDYDLDFYVGLAKTAQGPVLDICCGTGRIMLPCLRAGIDIEGLDLFVPMLDRLRSVSTTEGFSPKLHVANMSDFRLERRFALIMIPFNAFIHNMTAEAQIRCLTLCREHLQPGGLLAFDTFFPGRDYINLTDGERALEGEMKHPQTGQTIRMYDTRSFDRVRQIQHSHNEIEFLDDTGRVVQVIPSDFDTRYLYKNEMELLLRLAGFPRWQIYGAFDRRLLERDSDMMIVLAWNDVEATSR
jgi:SAM-dependent methyltransferase